MRYEIGARGRFALKVGNTVPRHLADGPCVIDLEPEDRLVWAPLRGDFSAEEIELLEASGVPLYGVILTLEKVSGHDLDALVRLAMNIEHLGLSSVTIDPADAFGGTGLRTLVLFDSWISAIPTTAEHLVILTRDLAPWIPLMEALPHLRLVSLLLRRGLELPSAVLQIPTDRLELPQINDTEETVLIDLFERAPTAPRAPLVVCIKHRTPELYERIERAVEGTGITLERGPLPPK